MNLRPILCFNVLLAFVTSVIIPSSYAQSTLQNSTLPIVLPAPGNQINLSPSYVPMMLTGLTVHPDNPFLLDFIVNTGNDTKAIDNRSYITNKSNRLIKYFLACLAIPEEDQWVNLSPYEKDRIIPHDLGVTQLGVDMLAEDYILKQLTASLIDPEKKLGKVFWDEVYTKARQEFGTTQVPVNTFNKVWIIPDTAKIYSHNNTVYVVQSHLRVMLEEDYMSLQKHTAIISSSNENDLHSVGSKIVRQIVLPAIEKEVNTGENFAALRQIFNSMILASWYKKNLKESLLNQVYTGHKIIAGVGLSDKNAKNEIYQQYIKAYKKGVFNYIREDEDASGQSLPRKYFSGGIVLPVKNEEEVARFAAMQAIAAGPGKKYTESLLLTPVVSNAMTASIHMAPATKNPIVIKETTQLLLSLGYLRPVIDPLIRAVTDNLNAGENLIDIRNMIETGLWRPNDHPFAEGLIESVWLQMAYQLNRQDFELVRNNWNAFAQGNIHFPVNSENFFSYKRNRIVKDAQLLNEFFQLVDALDGGLNGHTEEALAQIGILNVQLLPLDLFDNYEGEVSGAINGHYMGKPEELIILSAESNLKSKIQEENDRHDNLPPQDARRPVIKANIQIMEKKRLLIEKLTRTSALADQSHAMFSNRPSIVSLPGQRDPGGIDLNSSHLIMDSEGNTVSMHINPAMLNEFKNGSLRGMQFKILSLVPTNIDGNF